MEPYNTSTLARYERPSKFVFSVISAFMHSTFDLFILVKHSSALSNENKRQIKNCIFNAKIIIYFCFEWNVFENHINNIFCINTFHKYTLYTAMLIYVHDFVILI